MHMAIIIMIKSEWFSYLGVHSEVVYGCTDDADGLNIPEELVVGDSEGSTGYFLQCTSR